MNASADALSAPVVPLIEVTRGGMVESIHLGAVVVADAGGRVVWSAGDPLLVSFPRSSFKPFQLLALVAAGGVERFGFSSDEIAVMAGSHGAEPIHLETVSRVLHKIGAPPEALACGGAPSALHHNCSGKHAGMLALACALGAPLTGYVEPDHPVQQAIRACLIEVLELEADNLVVGVDGCGAPAYAVPMLAMARGFARLADPTAAPQSWRTALVTVGSAMRAHPELVAGTHGRLDTELMRLGRGLVAKSGAEGYFCVGHADGLGLALKIADGDAGSRARLPAAVAAAHRLGWVTAQDLAGGLGQFGPTLPVTNAAGRQVGEIRPAATLADSGH